MSNSSAARAASCRRLRARSAITSFEEVTSPEANSALTRGFVLRLVAVGAAGGALSALFGVGGGVVMVPLLILLCGYTSRTATATSLAAIAIIALWGTVTYGLLGNVDWGLAALVGIPALLGVVVGVRVRARISAVLISRVFAVVLVASAVLLVVNP